MTSDWNEDEMSENGKKNSFPEQKLESLKFDLKHFFT